MFYRDVASNISTDMAMSGYSYCYEELGFF